MMLNHKNFLLLSLVLLVIACKKDKDGSGSDPNLNVETFCPEVMELPNVLTESSGILYDDESGNHIWSMNDSGSSPHFYKIDIDGASIEQTKILKDGINKDWEAIISSPDHFFIGDFGNNNGSREDLVIYRIPKGTLNNSDSLDFETILFAYADQTDFTPSTSHNFDCEAMIYLEDKLYLFTKNRGNLQTHIYRLFNSPNGQVAERVDTLDVDGLITDATITDDENMVALLGYNQVEGEFNPFIWLLYDYPNQDFLDGKRKRIELPIKRQTEGLSFKDNNTLYFTCEEEDGKPSFLWSFDVAKWR